jgi:bifunctional UDP-N-acetylglucosamine pyrophosphorylase/glucosamine-1-phosphate N-acetyltransferase
MKKSRPKSSLRVLSSPSGKPSPERSLRKSSSDEKVRIAVAIMAAGKGTRLNSQHPKVLHEVGGKPLLEHVIRAAVRVVPASDVFAIIGHEADRVRESMKHTGVNFVLQSEQRGTGHALMVARDALAKYDHVIVLSGDAPLITSETIGKLRNFHLEEHASMTLLSAELNDPTGYGRVLRKGANGAEVESVVEEKAATPAQKKIREINSGFYVFTVRDLYGNIEKLSTNNPHSEYYLTDMAEVLRKGRRRVVAWKTANSAEVLGGNTRAELSEIDQQMRMAKCRQLMAAGVSIFYPATCVIDADVQVGPDTIIEPFVQLLGNTKIGTASRVASYCVIRDTEIGDAVVIRPGCIMAQTRVSNGAILGPYSHLRPGSDIGEGAHVGNFVETKKIKLGKGSKANHLTYLGDAEIGAGVNIGAGTITCNYDGVHKHKTIIGDGAFIGSDATLVAPVRVGSNSYIGAASCITEDVPDESLAIGRARQTVKEGWVREKKAASTKRT